MHELLFVGYSGSRLEDEQIAVVRNVACKYLVANKNAPVRFEHECCEGVLKHKEQGVYGALDGNYFSADLGEGQEITFFIPRGTEEVDLNGAIAIVKYSAGAYAAGKQQNAPSTNTQQ